MKCPNCNADFGEQYYYQEPKPGRGRDELIFISNIGEFEGKGFLEVELECSECGKQYFSWIRQENLIEIDERPLTDDN